MVENPFFHPYKQPSPTKSPYAFAQPDEAELLFIWDTLTTNHPEILRKTAVLLEHFDVPVFKIHSTEDRF